MECREFTYRYTKMGGLTLTVILNKENLEVIEPVRRRSRSGIHGEDIYCIEDWGSVIVLRFERSNRGNTYLYCSSNISEKLCNELRGVFEITDSVEETIKYLQSKLSQIKIEV